MTKWIRCLDKLPKISYLESDNVDDPYESYDVLLLSKEGDYCVGYLVKEQDENKWKYGDLSWEMHIPGEGGKIEHLDFDVFTHWMPLPETHKENIHYGTGPD